MMYEAAASLGYESESALSMDGRCSPPCSEGAARSTGVAGKLLKSASAGLTSSNFFGPVDPTAYLRPAQLQTNHPLAGEGSGDNLRPTDIYAAFQAHRPLLRRPSHRHSPSRSPTQDLSSLHCLESLPRVLLIGPNRPTREEKGQSDSSNRYSRVHKARGKFSDSRRKEVQEVRKRGACIRCRMLRKTVSGWNMSP